MAGADVDPKLVDEVATFAGWADPISRSIPYHGWRPVFSRHFALDGLPEPGLRGQRVLERLADRPHWLHLAPLLAPIVEAEIEDNEHTSRLIGSMRAGATQELLVGLLADLAAERPLLVVLDDAHWLDSASLSLALEAARKIRRLLLVLATRPMPGTQAATMERLRALSGTELLEVQGLDDVGQQALLATTFGVGAVPRHLVAWIRQKTQGNPFFSQEVARSLLEEGLVTVAEGRRLEAPGSAELDRVAVPRTVEGIVASRIDRLSVRQQLVLKTASVIGPSFSLPILRGVYPITDESSELEQPLEALVGADLLTREPADGEGAHAFKHRITLDVAYNMMPSEQRRRIHRAVAEWHERNAAPDSGSLVLLLAHHWDRADDDAKSLEYLEKAAALTLDRGAYQEAVPLLRRTRERDARLAPERSGLVDDARRARWSRQLADAHLGLGEAEECSLHVGAAMGLIAQPLPRSRLGWKGSLALQILRQVGHLLTARGRRAPPAAAAGRLVERRLEAARVATVLAERSFYDSDALVMATASLLAVNLAETAGAYTLVARSYALTGLFAGLSRLRALAGYYFRRARAVARATNDERGKIVTLLIEGNYHLCFGEFGLAYELYGTALAEAHSLGAWKEHVMLEATLATADAYTGRFRHSIERWSRIFEVGEERASEQLLLWALTGLVHDLLMLGLTDEAFARFAELERASERSRVENKVVIRGLFALGHLQRRNMNAARAAADETLAWIRELGSFQFYQLSGQAAPAAVYFELWQWARRAAPSEAARLRRRAGEACSAMRAFSRSFPVGVPRALLIQGQVHWMHGRMRRAASAWRRGLERARALGMPFDEGLLCHEIGRSGVLGPEESRRHLERASDVFAELGCAHHQARIREALQAASS